jgi:hypothetical protein
MGCCGLTDGCSRPSPTSLRSTRVPPARIDGVTPAVGSAHQVAARVHRPVVEDRLSAQPTGTSPYASLTRCCNCEQPGVHVGDIKPLSAVAPTPHYERDACQEMRAAAMDGDVVRGIFSSDAVCRLDTLRRRPSRNSCTPTSLSCRNSATRGMCGCWLLSSSSLHSVSEGRQRQGDGARPAIDLDSASIELTERIEAWRAAGFRVGRMTWREQGEGWPPTLKAVRGKVTPADSIGTVVRRGRQEGTIVLLDGGWCDLSFWSGNPADDVVVEAPGYPDGLTLDEYGAVLDRFIGLFG